MMKAKLLTLWLLLCLNVSAQHTTAPLLHKVAGRVVDANGLPLPGATLTLVNKAENYPKKLTTADSDGRFMFTGVSAGSYSILIKHIGFAEQLASGITVGAAAVTAVADIVLLPGTQELNEVSVSALTAKPLVRQYIDRTVINVGLLIGNTGVSAVEVLNNSPAVEVTESGIALRGKEGVTVYLDGRQLFITGQDLVSYLRSLPSASIDKIELMPNPPAKYHTQGGGVINIITKKNSAPGLSGNISLGATQATSFNTDNNANINYRAGKVTVYFTAAYSKKVLNFNVAQERNFYNDGTKLLQTNMETDRTRTSRMRLGGDYEINPHNKISVLLDRVTAPYDEKGRYLLQFQSTKLDSSVATQSTLLRGSGNAGITLEYQHLFKNPEHSLAISFDHLHYYNNTAQQIMSSTYLAGSGIQAGNYALTTNNPFNAKFYSLRVDLETELLHTKLSAGAQANYSGRNSEAIYMNEQGLGIDSLWSRQKAIEQSMAIYASINKKWNRLQLQAGLRYEGTISRNQQQNLHLSAPAAALNYGSVQPSFYLSYKLDTAAKHTLLLSASTRLNRPGYSSLNPFVFYFDKYSLLKGNPLLRPERYINIELSYNGPGGLNIGSGFSNGYNAMIQFYTLADRTLINTLVNIDRQTYLSVFLNYGKSPFKWLTINGYTELFGQAFHGPAGGNKGFKNKQISARLQLNNQIRLGENTTVELSTYYTTATTSGQGQTLPAWRMNGSLQQKLFNNRISVVLSASDLLRTQAFQRRINLSGAELFRRSTYDSRRISFTLVYQFGGAYKRPVIKSGLDTERGRVGA